MTSSVPSAPLARAPRARLAVLAILALAGCGTKRTIKAYPGPDLPATEVATVTVARPGIFTFSERNGLYVVAVDSVPVEEKGRSGGRVGTALVKPGQHSITVGYDDSGSYSTRPATIIVDAAAGVTYEIHAADKASFGAKLLEVFTGQGEWMAWMTERPSGRVVATAAVTGYFMTHVTPYYLPPSTH